MSRLIAAAFLAGTLLSAGIAQAMPLAQVAPPAGSDVIQVAGGLRPGLASRALWRMPAQLRQPGGACLPARLSHRPRRRLPRQRPLSFRSLRDYCITFAKRRAERSAVFRGSWPALVMMKTEVAASRRHRLVHRPMRQPGRNRRRDEADEAVEDELECTAVRSAGAVKQFRGDERDRTDDQHSRQPAQSF